jgi:hypothetical protein
VGKNDNTMLLLIGGAVVLVGGFMFKDDIMALIRGRPEPLSPPAQPGDVTQDPVIPLPTQTRPTPPTQIEYTQGMDYYASRIAEEIDKNSIKDVNRTTKFNIKGTVMLHYKSDLKKIVDLQSMTLGVGPTSLNEKSLRVFAQIVLKVCSRMGITLTPVARARFEKQAAGKYVLAMKGLIIS